MPRDIGVYSPEKGVRKLLQRGVDRIEIVLERRTKTIHGRDDRNRDSSGDNTVFDRGRARFIRQELQEIMPQTCLLCRCVEAIWQERKYQQPFKVV